MTQTRGVVCGHPNQSPRRGSDTRGPIRDCKPLADNSGNATCSVPNAETPVAHDHYEPRSR